MDKLRFGTGGIPWRNGKFTTITAMPELQRLDLDAMELEFVRSVNISEELAPKVNESAIKNDIKLTCHGSYYINLNSKEKEKVEASKQRIYYAAKIAALCGAKSCTFHPAYYHQDNPETVYQKIKKALKELTKKLENEGYDIFLRPETTGKASQWGNLKETIKLSQDIEQVLPCIDFSHLHARSLGKYNTYEEFREILTLIENGLGKEALNNMHCHLSGIEFGPKGEKNHIPLLGSTMNYPELCKVWKEFKIKGIVITETITMEKDAQVLKETYQKA